jgi:bifunctional non-homologous end joining protein LigD
VTYEQTKPFAKAIAQLLEERHPEQVVSDMKKALRVNKVFVDWSQNDDYKTTVNVYSLRAKDQPTVSTPVTWKEVETCLKKADPELLVFTSDQVLQRVEKFGDLFEPVLKLKQKLPPLAALGQGDSQPAASVPQQKAKRIQSARPARKTVAKTVAKPVKRTTRAR